MYDMSEHLVSANFATSCIALCAANQPLNRKMAEMVSCLSLCLKSYHENSYRSETNPVVW